MQRQREASYRPDILFPTVIVEATGPDGLVPTQWNVEDRGDDLYLKIINVGFGGARNVRLYWFIDFYTMITDINRMAEEIGASVSCYKEGHILRVEGFNSGAAISLFHTKNDNIDYILPVGERTDQGVRFPVGYRYLVSFYFYLLALTIAARRGSSRLSTIKYSNPTMTLKITYQDISEKEYTYLHEFEISIVSFSPERFSAIISSKKINKVAGAIK